jgi:tetratricopeptide (TPR) repeat protein
MLVSAQANLATTLVNLSAYYEKLGRFDESHDLLKQALTLREQAIGIDYPAVRELISKIAMLLDEKRKHDEQSSANSLVLEIIERSHGPYCQKMVIALVRQADIYYKQCWYKDAETDYKRALEIQEHCATHDEFVLSVLKTKLAHAYSKQARYAAAENLLSDVVRIVEKQFGAESVELATVLNYLAVALSNQHLFESAEPLFKRALGIRQKSLGFEHKLSMLCLKNLANTYKDLHKDDLAFALYKSIVDYRVQVHGPEHPSVQEAMNACMESILR